MRVEGKDSCLQGSMLKDCCWSRLVVGVIPQTTPTALQSALNQWRHLSEMTPTVLVWRMLFTTCSQANKFFVALSSKTHDLSFFIAHWASHQSQDITDAFAKCGPLAPGSICTFLRATSAFCNQLVYVFSAKSFFSSGERVLSAIWCFPPMFETLILF